jgi:hypothetical protein
VKVRADTDAGFDQALSSRAQTRQVSYRGDVPGGSTSSPRDTPAVSTLQPVLTERMQDNSPAEFYGGPMLKTRLGLNDTAGGELTREAARVAGTAENDPRDTTTLWKDAQGQISTGTPGSANVRNQVAQRYKATPGQLRAYQSAARADTARPNIGGQATDGNVHPLAVVTEVLVPSRFVFAGGGVQTWSVEREMPYGGRGDGARGANLNGERYYATGGYDNFMNGGMGQYGAGRLAGPNHRPTVFQEPAPWSTNYYDTTASVGTADNPGVPGQAPDLVYVSPQAGRRGNGTGRSG